MKEADVLLSLMIQELSSSRVSTKTLGNGETVCVIDKQVYIWNRQDWEQWREQARKKQSQPA